MIACRRWPLIWCAVKVSVIAATGGEPVLGGNPNDPIVFLANGDAVASGWQSQPARWQHDWHHIFGMMAAGKRLELLALDCACFDWGGP